MSYYNDKYEVFCKNRCYIIIYCFEENKISINIQTYKNCKINSPNRKYCINQITDINNMFNPDIYTLVVCKDIEAPDNLIKLKYVLDDHIKINYKKVDKIIINYGAEKIIICYKCADYKEIILYFDDFKLSGDCFEKIENFKYFLNYLHSIDNCMMIFNGARADYHTYKQIHDIKPNIVLSCDTSKQFDDVKLKITEQKLLCEFFEPKNYNLKQIYPCVHNPDTLNSEELKCDVILTTSKKACDTLMISNIEDDKTICNFLIANIKIEDIIEKKRKPKPPSMSERAIYCNNKYEPKEKKNFLCYPKFECGIEKEYYSCDTICCDNKPALVFGITLSNCDLQYKCDFMDIRRIKGCITVLRKKKSKENMCGESTCSFSKKNVNNGYKKVVSCHYDSINKFDEVKFNSPCFGNLEYHRPANYQLKINKDQKDYNNLNFLLTKLINKIDCNEVLQFSTIVPLCSTYNICDFFDFISYEYEIQFMMIITVENQIDITRKLILNEDQSISYI